MQIACPQCSMQYDLDPRLLPPAGVSVQCTQCRFVFTATASAPPAQPPAPGPVQAPASTPMTGAPKLNSTFIFGQSRPESAPAAPSASPHEPTASPSTTQPFGALPPDFVPPGMRPSPPPNQTQLFGKGELADVVARAEAASARTPISLPPEVLLEALTQSSPRPPRPAPRAPPLELPPELLAGPSAPPRDARAAEPRRKSGGLLAIGIVGVLVLVAALAYPVWNKRKGELPPEVLAAREEATALLRRDDAASREQAISRLRLLLSNHPSHVESQADLALTLALELDDLLVDIQRLQVAEERLRRQVRELGESKATADWSIRVNAMSDEVASLLLEREPLTERIQVLLNETEELQRSLRTAQNEEPPSVTLARLKAQAVHAGVKGASEVLALSERLRALESPPWHWATVAWAEYALNGNSPPSTLGEVSLALEAVREKDRTFLRAYMLGARVAMKLGDLSRARALIDEALTLNPNHTLARKMHEWLVVREREAAASP